MDLRINCLAVGLLVVLLVVAAFPSASITAEPAAYSAALADAQRTGKPLQVLVGATWCGPCREVGRYEHQLRLRGSFFHLDIDRHPDLYRRLPPVQGVPSLVIWDRDAHGGWRQPRVIVGAPNIRIYVEGGR